MPADFLGDQRDFDRAETEAAVRLWNRRGEPAHVSELLPRRTREAAAVACAIETHLEVVGLLEVAGGAFLQHPLVVGQIEVHETPRIRD